MGNSRTDVGAAVGAETIFVRTRKYRVTVCVISFRSSPGTDPLPDRCGTMISRENSADLTCVSVIKPLGKGDNVIRDTENRSGSTASISLNGMASSASGNSRADCAATPKGQISTIATTNLRSIPRIAYTPPIPRVTSRSSGSRAKSTGVAQTSGSWAVSDLTAIRASRIALAMVAPRPRKS